MVQPETARWLNESRGSFGAAQRRFNDISSMDVTGAAALFMSAEYAVKAVIAEHSFPTAALRDPPDRQPLASDRVVVPAPTRPAGAPGRHCAPRPQPSPAAADGLRRPRAPQFCAPRPRRPRPPRDQLRDRGRVVIERRVAAASDNGATVHRVPRARRDWEPRRLRQANLLTAAPRSSHGACGERAGRGIVLCGHPRPGGRRVGRSRPPGRGLYRAFPRSGAGS